MDLPHLCLFQDDDFTSAVAAVTKLLSKATNQSTYLETCPTRQELIRLSEAYPSLDTRLAHISPSHCTGPNKPFGLHHQITV
jgi:hypothetical protein